MSAVFVSPPALPKHHSAMLTIGNFEEHGGWLARVNVKQVDQWVFVGHGGGHRGELPRFALS